MSDPAPLTAADCDLRDFAFMPLEVERLRRSKGWLMAKRDPALGFHMLNLWLASWHEVPAASLEDDDDVLADIAMCEPKRWVAIREKALRGWVKCSDGRLYHPVVAEKAREAWERKQAQRQKTEAARQARSQNRQSAARRTNKTVTTPVTTSVTDNVTNSVTENDTDNVTTIVTASKGQGQGKREGESPPTPPGVGSVTDDAGPPADPLNCAEPGTEREGVGGFYWDSVWPRVCDAAGFPETAEQDTVRGWLLDGIEPDVFLPVIRRCAARAGYEPPRSPRYFDRPVREAAGKARAA